MAEISKVAYSKELSKYLSPTTLFTSTAALLTRPLMQEVMKSPS